MTWKLVNYLDKPKSHVLVKTYTDKTQRKIIVKDTKDIYKIMNEYDMLDRLIERVWCLRVYRLFRRLFRLGHISL